MGVFRRIAVFLLAALAAVLVVFGFFPVGNSPSLDEFRHWFRFFSLILVAGLSVDLGIWYSQRNKQCKSESSSGSDAFFYGLAFLSFLMLAIMVSVQLTYSPWAHSTMIGGKQETIQVSSVFSQIFPVVSTTATLFLTYVVFRQSQKAVAESEARQEQAQRARDNFQLQLDLQRRYEEALAFAYLSNNSNEMKLGVWRMFFLQEYQFHCFLEGRIPVQDYIDFCLSRRMSSDSLFPHSFQGGSITVTNPRTAYVAVRGYFCKFKRNREFIELFDLIFVCDNGSLLANIGQKTISDTDVASMDFGSSATNTKYDWVRIDERIRSLAGLKLRS